MKHWALALTAGALFSLSFNAQAADKTDKGFGKMHWAKVMSGKMAEPMTVNFDQTPLTNVMDFMRQATGLTIILDPELLEETPNVSLQVSDMQAGTLLNWTTKLTNTVWQVKDQAIFITTKENAAENTGKVLRFYDVKDLTLVLKDFPGPKISLQTSADGTGEGIIIEENDDDDAITTEDLVQLIKDNVSPESWDD